MEVENTAVPYSAANGNALAQPPPAAGYVMLLLIIPGFDHVSVGCAMLMGRLLQETMDGTLAGKGLLLAEPSYFRSKVIELQKATAARLKGMKAAQSAQGSVAGGAPGAEIGRAHV